MIGELNSRVKPGSELSTLTREVVTNLLPTCSSNDRRQQRQIQLKRRPKSPASLKENRRLENSLRRNSLREAKTWMEFLSIILEPTNRCNKSSNPNNSLNVCKWREIRGCDIIRLSLSSSTNHSRCQFHQHFTSTFFLQRCLVKLLCACSFDL
jgi:hypothetical protein